MEGDKATSPGIARKNSAWNGPNGKEACGPWAALVPEETHREAPTSEWRASSWAGRDSGRPMRPHAVNMLWLDSTYPVDKAGSPGAARGSCSTTSGVPAEIEKSAPNSNVAYSNIKFGPIGSTFNAPAGGGSGSSSSVSSSSTSRVSTSTRSSTVTTSTRTSTTTSSSPTTSAPGTNCQAKYAQCGGTGWTGSTCCASGSTCKVSNQYYSQCL
ncbi:hypothetical protein LA080_011721 [Diaporthe eres]|nr:hypothetical protein LA080_011721 [Diaporthe eres]